MKRLNVLWLSTEQLWIKNTTATKNARNSHHENTITDCVPATFSSGPNVFKFLMFCSEFSKTVTCNSSRLSLYLNRPDTSIDFNVEIQREWDYFAPKRLDIPHASKSPVCVYHLEEGK